MLFGFHKNDGSELTPCWVFTEHSQDFWSYNKLLIDLACSICILVKYRTPRFSARTSARCARSVRSLVQTLGAIHTSELDRSEIDLSPKRSKCERSNANWDRSKIDLRNVCEHFLKDNWDIDLRSIQLRSILVWMAPYARSINSNA